MAGWAAAGTEVLEGIELARLVLTRLNANNKFSDILNSLNGNFAIVVEGDGGIHIGVDAVRSIPLLYRQEEDLLKVSDDFRLLHRETDTLDWGSAVECFSAGYVTGAHTLCSEIKSLQSGEYLSLHPSQDPHSGRYYQYVCTYDNNSSIEDLCKDFDETLVSAFGRTIETLYGRQAVVPLSGGLDSRLVVSMLRRCGYDNVLCFSYGIEGNEESRRSREVAKSLGYPWVRLEYSGELWRTVLESKELKDYWALCGNGISGPHCDEWPAVDLLVRNGELSQDAVFLPGHTGDFICGSHLKYLFDPTWHCDPYRFNDAIVGKHYCMWEELVSDDRFRSVMDRRIEAVLGAFPSGTDEDLACKYEYWEWQERQAKLVINSVRLYDFFGYAWRIPLWDRAIMEFWKRIPIALKMNKFLYRTYLASCDPTGVFGGVEPNMPCDRAQTSGQRSRCIRAKVEDMVRTVGPVWAIWKRYERYQRHSKEFRKHPLGVARAFGPFRYLIRESGKRHYQSLVVKEFLLSQYGLYLRTLGSEAHLGGASLSLVPEVVPR